MGKTRTIDRGQTDSSHYQPLVQGLYESILITDVQGRILETNARTEELFLLSASELRRRTMSDIVSGFDENILGNVEESLATQKHVLIEASCARSDGTAFPAEIAVTKIAIGSESRLCFSVRDVTARNQTEDRLEEAQERLLKMDEIKTRMETIRRLADEINNPLQTLLTMVEADNNIRYAKPLNRIAAVMHEMRREEELKSMKYSGSSNRLALPGPDIEPSRARQILVVDDEPVLMKYFARVIDESIPDVKTDSAANGAEALASFLIKHHSVIVLDIAMPVMNGEQAFREIKRICKEKKWEMPAVIFCTGFTPPDSIREAIAKDSLHCFLAKPLTAETLVNAVRNRLEYYDLSHGAREASKAV